MLSNGDLPAMIVLDAVARRLPGALAEGSGELESFSAELGGGLEYPHYTRPPDYRGWTVPEVLLSGDHGRIEAWRRGEVGELVKDPLGRLFPNLPHSTRVVLDWTFTILGAIAIVLALKAWVVNPYRIPSSSMEPTLHCAQPSSGCEASGSLFSGRTACSPTASSTTSEPEAGRDHRLQHAPEAKIRCGSGGTFVKRLIGLPGETVHEDRQGFIYIDGKKLDEPYIQADRRAADSQHFNQTWQCRRASTSSWATTVGSRATRACGAPCRARTSSARCSSSTGRRAGSVFANLGRRPPGFLFAMSKIIESIERAQLRTVPRFKGATW